MSLGAQHHQVALILFAIDERLASELGGSKTLWLNDTLDQARHV